ncbi:MAG: histidinol-phosphate transaminase [Bacteroidota bacterium]|nr:histidinol-phosphate transaminase [Bacteroidota bacterium]
MFTKKKLKINRHLFYETSHSPSLVDIVGEKMLSKVTDFCFIANPYFPDKRLTKKLQERLPMLMKSYPSSNPRLSQEHLAKVLHVKPEQLLIGNGASELITIIQKEFIDDFAIPVPTFSEYTDKLKKQECAHLFQLPPEKNYQLDLDEYARWIDERGITSALIINPGNPTGQLLSLNDMIVFLNRMQHLRLIIVDESFMDFAAEDIPSLLLHVKHHPNVIIVRSMSKHCGVPGLRLGYCCTANMELLKRLRGLTPVWNINTIAEYFVSQLPATDAQYQKARLRVIKDVRYLYNELKSLNGFLAYPTASNFVLIKILCGLNATELQHKLLEEYHLYVRDCSNKTGMDNLHIRVASQGMTKDKLLIAALKEISAQYTANSKQ